MFDHVDCRVLTVVLESESTQVFACLHGIPLNLTLFSPLIMTLLQEIFKTDEGNFVQNEEKL